MPNQREYSPSDFLYGPIIGEGRFGSVVYAENAARVGRGGGDTNPPTYDQGYAMKMIPKSEILRYNLLQAMMTEKRVLSELLSNSQDNKETLSSSDGASSADTMVPKLFCCFHDDSSLYFVLELCSGGTMLDLFDHCESIRQDKRRNDGNNNVPLMDKMWMRYYAGQLVRVLEYIHHRGVIHRDISPRNILFTSKGDIKLCDFGCAVVIESDPGQAAERKMDNDFVGTADYVCPEMIRGSITQQDALLPAIDLWSLGCLIFQMNVGESPFHSECDESAFQRVLDFANKKSCLHFPSYTDVDAKELILSFLTTDAASRIGLSDCVASSKDSQKLYNSIRRDKFFDKDEQQQFWTLLESNSIEPPYKPAEQSWITQLRQNGTKMNRIDEMHFEL